MPKGKLNKGGGGGGGGGGRTTKVLDSLTNNTVVNTLVDGVDKVHEQVDKRVTPFTKDETFHAKGGTVEGFEQAESMVTHGGREDAKQRLAELEELLFRKDMKGDLKLREGSLELFNKVTVRLAGGGVLKRWGSRKVGGMRLVDALRQSFKGMNTHTGAYLVDMLRNDGVPSAAMQIADAYGLVSVKQSDSDVVEGVIKSVTEGMTKSQANATITKLTAFGIEVPKQIKARAKLGDKAESITTGKKKRRKEKKDEWLDSLDEKLAKAVRQANRDYKKTHGLLKGKPDRENKGRKKAITNKLRNALGKIKAQEIEFGLQGQARKHLKKPGNLWQLEQALDEIKAVDPQLRKRLLLAVTSKDLENLLDVEPLEAKPWETSEETQLREMDDRKEKGKNLASVATARALMGRKGFGPDELKKGGLVAFVEKMKPDARQMLVASFLPPDQRQAYLSPSTPMAARQAAFAEAWENGGLRTQAERALHDQDKLDKIKKSQDEKKTEEEKDDVPHLKRAMVRLQTLLRDGGDAGPNYMALLDLAEAELGTKVSTVTHGTRIWEIALRMKGAELFQIRNDVPLLLRLRKLVKGDLTKPSVTNWNKTMELLQLPTELKLGVKGNDAPTLDSVDVENRDGNGDLLDDSVTLGQAYQGVADSIEFSPKYWVMQLHRLVKMISPSKSDTYSVVVRAQEAAKRWVVQEQARRTADFDQEELLAQLNGDDPPPEPAPATEAEFLRRIFDAMSPEDQQHVEKKIPKAYAALANGVHLSTDVRLDRAKGWKLGGEQTSLFTNKAAIVASFEDLGGRELMEEWSNVGELQDLHEERSDAVEALLALDPDTDTDAITTCQAELQSISDRMATWWPSINREKLAYIEGNLSGATRTEVLGMLSLKLAGAMRGDPEFKQAAVEAGLDADDYDAERLLFGHTMNKRRQLDTGLQYGARSQMDALRTARSLRNPFSAKRFIEKDGDHRVNKTRSQARKAQSNIYLAKVRNTQAKLNEVKGDKTLTDEQRQEKAKHLRETGAKDIEQTREELEKRNKAFTKARKALSKVITKIVQVLLLVAVTAATAGQGTAAVVIGMILAGIAREASKAIAQWVLQGDAFEHKDLAKAIFLGAVKGALRAATMELLSAIDAVSEVVDFDMISQAAQDAPYAQVLTNGAVQAAMRSAIVDVPANQLKYFMNTERPFRDLGRNFDVLLTQNISSIAGRQLVSIFGGIAGQGSQDVEKAMGGGGGSSPSSGMVGNAFATFEQTSKQQVAGLVGRLGRLGRVAKMAVAKGFRKVYGKYPELWKQLANESVLAISERKDLEEKLDALDLPDQKEIDRVMALLDELVDGSKSVGDLTKKDKESLGLLIAYGRQEGVAGL